MTPAAERRPLLPFAWARAHHLVLLSDGECCEALCRPDTAARALLEARRLADGPMRVSRLAPEAFEKVLVLSYQRDSAEAHRMMADIGNELDLYTLAEELPDTDDLLDSEDDAPHSSRAMSSICVKTYSMPSSTTRSNATSSV